MSSAGPEQSNHSSSAAASSSSTSASNISRANPSPPMTPGRQQATLPSLLQQPSVPTSLVVRGRNRELQQLNNEIQLLEEELKSLDNIPPASDACKDLVTFVENRADPFFPNSDGTAPQSWPYDRPVKASRCCWKF
ncbi:hypothetical protein M758_9G188000 [Ceratodon purpureus]|uniref:G protein gamma domain-containing protein n=1 Tax=Ceratodon purpureus TaxID=3225 RepID=A0A8T0GWT9_CERPU|nr:hypothetical protein KC19_9G190300 [Ceratodon purpureus]KAG0607037.1 hypothetical protein M758_9G188000 [Ceratodon purpureus]